MKLSEGQYETLRVVRRGIIHTLTADVKEMVCFGLVEKGPYGYRLTARGHAALDRHEVA